MPTRENSSDLPAAASAESSSARAGRADEATYAEALQAVEELKSVVSEQPGMVTGVTDRIEGMLLGELEAADAVEEVEEDARIRGDGHWASQTAEEACSPGSPTGKGGEQVRSVSVSGYELLGSADTVTTWHSLCRIRCEKAPKWLWDQLLALTTVSPLMLTVLVEAPDDGPFERGALWALLLYSYAAARLITLGYEAIARLLLQYRPIFTRVSLMVQGSFGWPSTIVVCVALNTVFPLAGIDEDRWRTIEGFERFWPTCYWLLGASLSWPMLDCFVQFYVNDLTLRHYEQRAREAHQAQTVLRGVVAAARSAEREMKESAFRKQGAHKNPGGTVRAQLSSSMEALPSFPRPANAVAVAASRSSDNLPIPTPPTSSTTLPGGKEQMDVSAAAEEGLEGPACGAPPGGEQHDAPKDRTARFFMQLDGLTGALEFGAGFADAASLEQARRRAAHIFGILRIQPALSRNDGDVNGATLGRAAILTWACARTETERDTVGEQALFRVVDEVIDEETFVSSIERVYKESRLLTASVASFDRINALLYKTCVGFWVVLLGLAFAIVWQGRDIAVWVIPSVSVLASLVVILGKAPADVFSGAIYTLLLRPFDIGDRVIISQPGQQPTLYSLIVKEIDVVRTHFLTANGELLLIENHMLRNMSITNLSRSGETTLLVQVQVPVATPHSKITELVDSIKQYCSEKDADWIAVEPIFSSTDFSAGHINLDIWVTCRHPAQDVLLIYGAKSSLLLFIHAYMQSASIEYIKPLVPMRLEGGVAHRQAVAV